MQRNNPPVMNRKLAAKSSPVAYPTLLTGIGALLEESRRSVARAANCFMTATYWEIGRRIVEFEQGGKKRAEYGDELLKRLGADLSERFGRGFSKQNLERMRRFYLTLGTDWIASTLSRQLLKRSDSDHRQKTDSSILSTVSRQFTLSQIGMALN